MRFSYIFFLSGILVSCSTATSVDIEKAKNNNVPLLVSKLYTSPPNSAGGIDVHLSYTNTATQTFKYVVFEVVPFNRVGDIAPSEIGRKITVRLNDVGPIEPGRGNSGGYWKNVWYNSTIQCVELRKLELTHMDGRIESYVGAELSKMISSKIRNSCSVR